MTTIDSSAALPLHSFMQGLLLDLEQEDVAIIDDNAVMPSRSFCSRQRRQVRQQPVGRSYSASPCVLTRKKGTRPGGNDDEEKRSQWQKNQQREARRYSFESPISKKPTLASMDAGKRSWQRGSPTSTTAFLSPLSPKSARWSPHQPDATFLLSSDDAGDQLGGEHGINTLVSPRSARWHSTNNSQPSSMIRRQESFDSFLVCPERVVDIPVCTNL